MLTYPHEEENCHSSRSRKHHIHSERVRSLCFSKRILHLTKAALRLYAMRLNYYFFFLGGHMLYSCEMRFIKPQNACNYCV